jgi:hypothetical protein
LCDYEDEEEEDNDSDEAFDDDTPKVCYIQDILSGRGDTILYECLIASCYGEPRPKLFEGEDFMFYEGHSRVTQ